MAMTAWSAKVLSSATWLFENGPVVARRLAIYRSHRKTFRYLRSGSRRTDMWRQTRARTRHKIGGLHSSPRGTGDTASHLSRAPGAAKVGTVGRE
jgi:hypothetical protein